MDAAFFSLTGYSWEEVRGRNCRFLQGPRTEVESVQRIREAIAGKKMAHVSILNYSKSGRLFRNLLVLRPVFEYESEADATEQRNGTYRYMLGMQHLGPLVRLNRSAKASEARLVELDALTKLLPSTIIRTHVAPQSVSSTAT